MGARKDVMHMYQERFWKDAEDTLVLAVERYQQGGGLDSMMDLLNDYLVCEKSGSKSKLDTFYGRLGVKHPDDIGYLAYSDFKKCGNVDVRCSVINSYIQKIR